MRPEFGMGLDGVLQMRRDDFTGILNGVDETVWSPETDPKVKNYKTPIGKRANSWFTKEFNFMRGWSFMCCCLAIKRTKRLGSFIRRFANASRA